MRITDSIQYISNEPITAYPLYWTPENFFGKTVHLKLRAHLTLVLINRRVHGICYRRPLLQTYSKGIQQDNHHSHIYGFQFLVLNARNRATTFYSEIRNANVHLACMVSEMHLLDTRLGRKCMSHNCLFPCYLLQY